MKMKELEIVFLIFGLCGIGFAFPFAPAFAQTKPIELSYSIFFPAPHKNTVLAGEWAKEVEKRTNGG